MIHGAYHGAWCWDRLRPELERLGHRVVAMDLPISDPSLGAADYASAVEAAVAGLEQPVLVAHSMGGIVAPIVAARRSVRSIIFVAAFLPRPGVSVNEQRASEALDGPVAPTTAQWTDLGEDVWMVGPATATELFFHDASPDVVAWATERLRPQAYRALSEVSPLASWPDVECHSIVCRDDRAINPAWVRSAARERLGVEAVEIEGGHSPFMTRPAGLAAILDAMVRSGTTA